MGSKLTDHARKRMSQRGVKRTAVDVVIEFGDRRIHVGKGCQSIYLSRGLAAELAKEGEISAATVDRVANLVVVVANDNENGDEEVLTVVRPKNRKSGRSYRKAKGYERRPQRKGRH